MSLLVLASPGLRLARASLWTALVVLLLVAQMEMHCHHGTAALGVHTSPDADTLLGGVDHDAGHDHGTDEDHGDGEHQDGCQRNVTPVVSGPLLLAALGAGLAAIVPPAMAETVRALALLIADRYAAGAPRGPTTRAGTELLLSISVLRL